MSTTLARRRSRWSPRRRSASRSPRQLQLTWWRFRRHRLAVVSAVIVLAVLSGRGLRRFPRLPPTRTTPTRRAATSRRSRSTGSTPTATSPARLRAEGHARPAHLQADLRAGPEPERAIWGCSRRGYAYDLFGLIPTDRHLLGVANGRPQDGLFLLGTDLLGRDLWSRLMLATPHLADHRPCRRDAQPVARRSARRHLRAAWRLGRHRHPARDRDPALDPDHPAVDGPRRRFADRPGRRSRSISRSPSSSR